MVNRSNISLQISTDAFGYYIIKPLFLLNKKCGQTSANSNYGKEWLA